MSPLASSCRTIDHRMMALQQGYGTNTTLMLTRRSRGGVRDAGALSRLNLKILRTLLLQKNRKYTKVWSKSSVSRIMYEDYNIYFDNYQSCYNCLHSEPHLLYKLPKRSKVDKFEDLLLCQGPLERSLASASDQKPSLLALTANNWLYRLSAKTGEELERVFLSSRHKFKYLGWDSAQEICYVKSIQSKETTLARQVGILQNNLMHLAIFRVFPLQVVGVMEINKKIFGNSARDLILSQGVLAVSYTKSVKLFSFEHIVKQFMTEKLTLGKRSSLLGGRIVGESPFGIPVNIQITECPPVLFEVQCSPNGIQIGGFPWHFIHTPLQTVHKGTHHIRSLGDGTLAENGVQNMDIYSLESDEIFFHPDVSGRIVHFGPTTINVLKLIDQMNKATIVKEICIETKRNTSPASQVTVTSSGRTVKRRVQLLDDDPDQETFRMLEYEDELDLIGILVTHNDEREGRARFQLHDNFSGRLLQTIDLVETWDETFQHELYFDKDTLVHVEQKNNTFCCHVYKLMAPKQK